MNKTNLMMVFSIFILWSCHQNELKEMESFKDVELKPNMVKTNTFYSRVVQFGNGQVRTYYTENKSGVPIELGIILTERTMENLPEHVMLMAELPYHQKAKSTPFTHATVEWNPEGHEPDDIYTLPHFDFHFYHNITSKERMEIPGLLPPATDVAPDQKYWPPLYFLGPGIVPEMGAHWIDLLAPEFNGGVFTKTFIYGSYNGKFIFYEPMVTLEYLLTKPDEKIEIRQPSSFQSSGYYPTKYRISFTTHPNQYVIGLTDFVYREAE
jgi:hypothetical protein